MIQSANLANIISIYRTQKTDRVSNNRTASIIKHNEKLDFIWLAKKDNLMLLN